MRQNDYWLNTVLSGASQHPEQFDWSRSIQEDYARIEAEELSALAKEYLDPSKAALFEARPANRQSG